MIEIPRSLVRPFRDTLLHAFRLRKLERNSLSVVFEAAPQFLAAWAEHDGVTIRYQKAARGSPRVVSVPGKVLDEFVAGKAEAITLSHNAAGKLVVQDQGRPHTQEYDPVAPRDATRCPELPKEMKVIPGLLPALLEAVQTSSPEKERYATHRLFFRGSKGQIVATDNRQLLVQGGFRLPFRDDLLVPASRVFTSPELAPNPPMALGCSQNHLAFHAGPWTFFLAIDRHGRFPNVAGVIPARKAATLWRLTRPEAARLAKGLADLPGHDAEDAPITVDLHRPTVVRARGTKEGAAAEFAFAAEVVGPPLRFACNRTYLIHALALGFTEFRVFDASTAVLARDCHRQFAWMPLGPTEVLPPATGSTRKTEPINAPLPPTAPNARPDRAANVPPAGTADTRPNAGVSDAVIAEATALHSLLRDAGLRSQHLLAALKQQHKASRSVAQVLASLRRLPSWVW